MITKLANDYLSMSREDYVKDRMHNFDEKFDQKKKEKRNKFVNTNAMIGGVALGGFGYGGVGGIKHGGIKAVATGVAGGILGAGLGAVEGKALAPLVEKRYEKSREPIREGISQAFGRRHDIFADMSKTQAKTPGDRDVMNRQLGAIQLA